MATVLLVESFYGGSHRSWVDSWVRHSRHDVSLVSHTDEFWRWRLRGGAVTLAEMVNGHVATHGPPDALVISGLVDAASLVGISRRALSNAAVALYVHESELLYPKAPNQKEDSSAALTNWRSLVAADALWFNSAFHRDALHEALPGFLQGQPDPQHLHLINPTFEKARVLWPGVETQRLISAGREDRVVPRVLWNQRWDHDKNPHAVFSALAHLADDGVPFTLALAGENQRPDRTDFVQVLGRLSERIDHSGFAPAGAYEELLLSSDVVVSAADHEFFGIAIVEAMAAGAVPVLPDRLSFPELVAPQWHDAALYADGDLRSALRHTLSNIATARDRVAGLRESMQQFDASAAATAHDDAVDDLIRQVR